MIVLEAFGCSGGMAEGLRRGGLPVDMAFDYDADACASYTRNLGHAPIRMDVRDLLRMVESGWHPGGPIDLFVADPPCAPWSRAGKRKGQEDERDMIADTVSLVRLLRPKAFLIANIPGLDDGPNWPIVQKTIGSLTEEGYCIDFQRLDACNYGVPQHRIRPFWFGHAMRLPHIQWPAPTHADPKRLRTSAIPGCELAPWVTCRQALGHLSGEDLGVPVRLRWRGANGKQVASVPDAPSRVVGTSSLSDGNVLAHPTEAVREGRAHRHPGKKARASSLDEPARVVTTRSNGDGNALTEASALYDGPNHRPSVLDAPARTLTKNTHGEPAFAISASDGGGSKGARCLTWPWDRPTTVVHSDVGGRLAPPGHHAKSFMSDNRGHGPNAVKLSEKAAAILQGFPDGWLFAGETKKARWAQIGMAMPPPLAHAVAKSIRAWFGKQEDLVREATRIFNGESH